MHLLIQSFSNCPYFLLSRFPIVDRIPWMSTAFTFADASGVCANRSHRPRGRALAVARWSLVKALLRPFYSVLLRSRIYRLICVSFTPYFTSLFFKIVAVVT